MTYNKSEIMQKAWVEFKKARKGGKLYAKTFSQCLKESWKATKAEAVEKASGIVEMHYSEYKNNYANCKTVYGSYDKYSKTIKVYTKGYVAPAKAAAPAKMTTKASVNGKCRICGTWCYGDCTAYAI